jgi:hypothetical protein
MKMEDSQSSFVNQTGELVLIQETCLQMSGPLGYMGLLSVTNERVIFEPKGKMDKLIGAQIRSYNISDIQEARFGGLQQRLTLRFKDSKTRYSGPGARRVWSRLCCVLFEHGIDGGIQGPYESDERILVSGVVQLMVSGLLGTEGEVSLTDRRLHYSPGRGPERFLWPGRVKVLDLALDSITELELTSLGRRLLIKSGEETYNFSGSIVPKLYSSLASLGPVGTTYEERSEVLATWDGMRFLGPLGSAGQIVITERSLHYQPGGRLDVAFGVEGQDILFSDIHEMKCGGWPEKRLTLTLPDGKVTFGLENLLERFMDLTPLVTAAVNERSLEIAHMFEYRSEEVLEVIGARSDDFQIPWDEKVMAMSPASRWHDPMHVERGWLLLTDQHLHFLPFCLKNDIETYALDLTLPPPVDDFDPTELLFELGGSVHRFIPLSADRFTAKFWTLMDRGSEDNAWRRKWGTDFQNLVGDVPSLEIFTEGRPVAKLRPAVTVAHSYGFGIVFPGAPGEELKPGSDVEISVNNDGGRYRFSGTVVKHERYTSSAGSSAGAELQLIIIAHTPLLAIANRRQYFRVPMEDRVAIIPQAGPGSVKRKRPDRAIWCLFNNLSVGGCAIYSDQDFVRGSGLHVLLPTPHLKLRVRAEVLSTRRAPTGPLPFLYRVRFIHKSSKQMEAVGDLVMKMQRELLIEQGEISVNDEETARSRAVIKQSMKAAQLLPKKP